MQSSARVKSKSARGGDLHLQSNVVNGTSVMSSVRLYHVTVIEVDYHLLGELSRELGSIPSSAMRWR